MTDPATLAAWRDFVLTRTAPAAVQLVPEVRTYQAAEITPLWRYTSAELSGYDPNPFWAFPWAGGQAMARHLLDHPGLVRGLRVLDFATGSGLVAVAAKLAGAAEVVGADVAPFCEAVVPLNAALNGVEVGLLLDDLLGAPLTGFDLVVAGDVFYEKPLAERSMAWFKVLAGQGVRVLVGDPGRLYTPQVGVVDRAEYQVPVSVEIEDRPVMRTWVLEVLP